MLMQHPGLDSCIVTEKIVKLSCTVKSLYFTMAEPKRRCLVPGYQVTLLPAYMKSILSNTILRLILVNTCPMLVVDEDVIVEDVIRSENQAQYVYGDVVQFSCTEGHQLDGSESTVCNADGRWTSRPPTCQRMFCVSCLARVSIIGTI